MMCIYNLLTYCLPAYITPYTIIKGATTIFHPIPRVALFFQKNAANSTMVALTTGQVFDLDFQYATSRTVTYTDQDSWVPESSSLKIDAPEGSAVIESDYLFGSF